MAKFDQRLNRRSYLAAAGACIALPFFPSLPAEATTRALKTVATKKRKNAGEADDQPRLVCMGVALSMYPGEWNPVEEGRNYKTPRLIKPLESLRDDFTLISNTDHPGVKGGHKGTAAFLSGVYKPERIGQSIIIRNQITIDQLAAKEVGADTRFESMQMSVSSSSNTDALSWSEKGIPLSAATDPLKVFRKLFAPEKNPKTKARSMKLGGSVLDLVHADAKALQRELASDDRNRMDDYMSSVRDVEKRIERELYWLDEPKPGVPPVKNRPTTYHQSLDLMLELTALALQTDSTRVITMGLPGNGPPIEAGNLRIRNYHGQSHHGKAPKVVEELIQIELQHTRSLAKFLARLKSIPAANGTLLDHTQVLFGSGLGNASSHSNRDLPVLLAGGGFKHGQHLKLKESTPLANLFVTMLQQMGIQTDTFAGSNGDLNRLLKA